MTTIATVVGYAAADAASADLRAGIDGFAAGALLVLLIDSMIPEASRKAGRVAGLITTLGFAVAAGLSTVELHAGAAVLREPQIAHRLRPHARHGGHERRRVSSGSSSLGG